VKIKRVIRVGDAAKHNFRAMRVLYHCPGKMRSTEMRCSNSVVMLKLALKFNAPESVVPAKAGTQ